MSGLQIHKCKKNREERCARTWQNIVFVIACGILLVFFLVFFRQIKAGIYEMTNMFLEFLTGKTGKIHLLYPVENATGIYYLATFLVAVFALGIARMLFTGNRLPMIVLLFLAYVGCAIGCFQVDEKWLCIVAGMLLCLLYGKLLKGSCGSIWKSMCVPCFILGLCFGTSVILSNFVPVDTSEVIHKGKQVLHETMYHQQESGMPEGNLSNVKRFVKSGETSLVISAEKPQKFYLRGFVGEVYTGTSWESFDSDVNIANDDLFYWLHKMDFYGQNSIAKASILSGNQKEYEMKISNYSACDGRQFLPYGLSGSHTLDEKYIGDGAVSSTETEYSYLYTEGSIPQWYQAALYLAEHESEPSVQAYLRLEQSYRQFAYAHDLQITNNVVGVCENLFGTGNEEHTLSDILDLVRNTLEEQISYNDMIHTYNENNDFFQYTLEQRKEGYSVHFATAATLMLRYFGVPARYVEGYYISTEEMGAYAPGEEVPITEANAHAWPEFYLDGVGWIPFEVTPGYIDEDELLAAKATIADGLGTEQGKTFAENPLKYAPPPTPKEDLQTPDVNSHFQFRTELLLYLGAILVVVLVCFFLGWISLRRRKLYRFWNYIEQADHKEAITQLFAYGTMVMKTCKVQEKIPWDVIQKINQEALFSNHHMTEEQRQQMERFVKDIIHQCKQTNTILQKIRYHYILWLYR